MTIATSTPTRLARRFIGGVAWVGLWIVTWSALSACAVDGGPGDRLEPMPAHSKATVAEGSGESTFAAAATRHVVSREYWASSNRTGLQAPNRRHGLRTYFGPRGVRVVERVAASEAPLLALELVRFGRTSTAVEVAPATVHAERSRVELRRAGLVEWYDNGPAGLEHGFTVSGRPAGAGRLAFRLRVSGARATLHAGSAQLRTRGGRVLDYGKLFAFDSSGQQLPAELAVPSSDEIVLFVDDREAVYPIVVDPLLTSVVDTFLSGAQNQSFFGTRVAAAGDVNGDGLSDVIIVAPGYDSGEQDEGAAFVFHGRAPVMFSGSHFEAQTQIETNQALAGVDDAAGAGDVNGDGYADVVVGSAGYDAGDDGGAAFIFLGGPSGIADGNPSTAHAVLESDDAGSDFAVAVGAAGDVNGDGFGDVIVGAPHYPNFLAGAVFVFHGSAAGIADATASQADSRIDGTGDEVGASVAWAGDVNGDGYDDVIVGAPEYTGGASDEGGAWIFHGSASGIASGGVAQADTVLRGGMPDCYLGGAVAGAGDVDGDGYADVIVGGAGCRILVENEGGAFIFHGRAGGIADDVALQADTVLRGGAASANMGSAVAGAGDVNADGFADVIVGASTYSSPEVAEGAAFVFLGRSSGVLDGDPSAAYVHLEQNFPVALLGTSVAGVGDVNGDGFADVIVGAPNWASSRLGAAYVYHGGAGLRHATALDVGNPLIGEQLDAGLGVSVASAGDVNGDGYDDVIVGAKDYDAGEAEEGAAFVFHGGPLGILGPGPPFAAAQLESDQIGGGLGSEVASAGDVNGDGYDDVIVGTDGYDNPESDEGVAFVFHGSATGIGDRNPSNADATIETNQSNAAVGNGTFVASAGDVNGDGYSDVLFGAPFWDGGGINDRGIGLLFLGSAAGIGDGDPDNAWFRFEGGELADRFGSSVASAGDVDGDGLSDVIFGWKLDNTTFGASTGSALVLTAGPRSWA